MGLLDGVVGFASGAAGQGVKILDDDRQKAMQMEMQQHLADIQETKAKALEDYKVSLADKQRGQVGEVISKAMDQRVPFQGEATGADYSRDMDEREKLVAQADALNRAGYTGEADKVAGRLAQYDTNTTNDEYRSGLISHQDKVLDETARHNKAMEGLYGDKTAARAGSSDPSIKRDQFDAKEWHAASKDLGQFASIEDPVSGKAKVNVDAVGLLQGEMNRLRNDGANPYDAATVVGNKLMLLRQRAEELAKADPRLSMDASLSAEIRRYLKLRQSALSSGPAGTGQGRNVAAIDSAGTPSAAEVDDEDRLNIAPYQPSLPGPGLLGRVFGGASAADELDRAKASRKKYNPE